MEFMDMMREWLDLRDAEKSEEDLRSIPQRALDRDRMLELEQAINARLPASGTGMDDVGPKPLPVLIGQPVAGRGPKARTRRRT